MAWMPLSCLLSVCGIGKSKINNIGFNEEQYMYMYVKEQLY